MSKLSYKAKVRIYQERKSGISTKVYQTNIK